MARHLHGTPAGGLTRAHRPRSSARLQVDPGASVVLRSIGIPFH